MARGIEKKIVVRKRRGYGSAADGRWWVPERTPMARLLMEHHSLIELRLHYQGQPESVRRASAMEVYETIRAPRMGKWIVPLVLEEGTWYGLAVVLSIDPRCAPAILNVGEMERGYGRKKESMEYFLSLPSLVWDSAELVEIIDEAATFLMGRDEYEEAAKLYGLALRKDPDNATYYSGLSYCAAKMEMLDQAVEYARKACRLDPGNSLYLNDLGWALVESGMCGEAQTVLEKAVRLSSPDFRLARRNLEEARKRSREWKH